MWVTALLLSTHVAAAGAQGRSLAQGWNLLEATYLIELKQGSALSDLAGSLIGGGYETSEGRPVSFERWYSTRWTDVRLTWMSQLSPNLGLIWGASTGERGEKYEIRPSLKLGLAYQASLDRRSSLSLRATTILGGRIKERACTADYGDVGGIQAVNCRLAASEMEPARTLDYLVDLAPRDREMLIIRYQRTF